LPSYRRHILTSSVLRISERADEAETLNTTYKLRRPIEDVAFDGVLPVRFSIADLVAQRFADGATWEIRHNGRAVASGLASMSIATLAMLGMLDQDQARIG